MSLCVVVWCLIGILCGDKILNTQIKGMCKFGLVVKYNYLRI